MKCFLRWYHRRFLRTCKRPRRQRAFGQDSGCSRPSPLPKGHLPHHLPLGRAFLFAAFLPRYWFPSLYMHYMPQALRRNRSWRSGMRRTRCCPPDFRVWNPAPFSPAASPNKPHRPCFAPHHRLPLRCYRPLRQRSRSLRRILSGSSASLWPAPAPFSRCLP